MIRSLWEPLRNMYCRLSLPKQLAWHRNLRGQDVLTCYLTEPEHFWKGPGLRHAKKVRQAQQAFMSVGVSTPEQLAAQLFERVSVLRHTHDQPFFVMGAGGSGSTWLGAMLGDLPDFTYGREIYLPPSIAYLVRRFKTQDMYDLVWALMLLPSWAWHHPSEDFASNFVNSGRSLFNDDLYRDIWPRGRFIMLVRDPRDQVFSTSYRKASYRQAVAPHAADLTYLRHNAKKAMGFYQRYMQSDPEDFHLVKYEQLKDATPLEMNKLLHWARLEVEEAALASAIYRHSAANMRQGLVPVQGNLDEGGIATNWRQVMTEPEKHVIKQILQGAIEAFDYEQNADW